MRTETRTVSHAVGLHARPAALFVRTAKQYDATIRLVNVTRGSDEADAKSLVDVFKAAVARDHVIELTAEGPDEDAAMQALIDLVDSNFGE